MVNGMKWETATIDFKEQTISVQDASYKTKYKIKQPALRDLKIQYCVKLVAYCNDIDYTEYCTHPENIDALRSAIWYLAGQYASYDSENDTYTGIIMDTVGDEETIEAAYDSAINEINTYLSSYVEPAVEPSEDESSEEESSEEESSDQEISYEEPSYEEPSYEITESNETPTD